MNTFFIQIQRRVWCCYFVYYERYKGELCFKRYGVTKMLKKYVHKKEVHNNLNFKLLFAKSSHNYKLLASYMRSHKPSLSNPISHTRTQI